MPITKHAPAAAFKMPRVYRGAPSPVGSAQYWGAGFQWAFTAPVPGFVPHELFSGAWPHCHGELELLAASRRDLVFQTLLKGAVIQNPLLHCKGIAFHLSFYLQTSQVSNRTK